MAYLNPSTVYRILRREELVCPWRRRKKRNRSEDEKAQAADEIWATDLKYVRVGARNYYLISFLDEYSRYIMHHELLERWIADPASNYGVIFQNYVNANTDDLDFRSRETGAGPKLTIEYGMPGTPAGNQPPTVNAGADQTIVFGDGATLQGAVSDDGQQAAREQLQAVAEGPPAVKTVL